MTSTEFNVNIHLTHYSASVNIRSLKFLDELMRRTVSCYT